MTIKKCRLIIYKVTCLVNQKVYIGFTKRDSAARWSDHVSNARNGSELLIHRAIRKHGAERFVVEDIDEAEDLVRVGELEEKWIVSLGSRDRSTGYNIGSGGIGGDFYFKNLSPEERKFHNQKISQSKLGCKPKVSEEVRHARSEYMSELNKSGRAARRSYFKKLIGVSPLGDIHRTDQIPAFCKNQNLPYGAVLRYARGHQKKLPKGWWFTWDADQNDMDITKEWRNHVQKM